MNIFTLRTKKVNKYTAKAFSLLMLTLSSYFSFAQAPANDDPCAATTLTVGASCTYQTFTNVNSTPSPGFPAPGCANFAGGDVWFQVTVPAGGSLIFDTQAGSITDAGMAIYSGNCNTMTLIECDDDDSPNGNMPMITRTGLTPGSTIYIRVWEYGGDFQGTFGICVTTPPPPPANDDPCAAISLTASATCNFQTFTTAGATNSTGFPAPGCANYNGADVWFQVTVPAGGALIFDSQTGVITDAGMAIYSGDCNTMTLIECDDDDSPNGAMSRIERTGLTPGSTIWIRFWEYGGDNNGTFGICVTFPPPPPANDNCTGAVALTVNSTLTCTAVTAGTTQSATATAGVPAPTCNAAGATDDVWYSFVATNTIHRASLLNVTGTATAMAMAIYSGTCGTLTSLQCVAGNTLTQNGLTVGQTYYVRVWTTATTTASANFNICIATPPPPPANDEPCNAIVLTAAAACTYQTYTTASATNTTAVPGPGCASYNGGDVWFQVTVPAGGALIFDSQTGVITDGGMAIYSGTCNGLTLIECDDDDSPNGLMPRIIRSGLTPGSTIWIRFWEYGGDNNGTFGICVTIPPPPPAYDEVCNAALLTVDPNGGCNMQTFTTQSATPSVGVPAPGCGNYAGGDVWFKTVVPCSGRLVIDTDDGSLTDAAMAIYRGTCNNLQLIVCAATGSSNGGSMPKIDRSGLTVGDTIWIRVWEEGNNDFGTFRICASSPTPPVVLPPLPPSPSCGSAQPFCTSTTPFVLPNVSGGGSVPGGGIYDCLATIPNPTYYTLQIQTSGDIELTISQTNTAGALIDVDFVIWGPFNSPASCGQLALSNVVDCSYSTAGTEIINIPNGVAGQYYTLLVTNFQGGAGQITYQQTGGTGSTACCTMSATNSGPVFCQGGGSTVNFTATTVANATYSWTGPNCFTSSQQNPTNVPVPSAPGQYIYTVVAYNLNGQVCSDTTIVTVTARPNIGADTTIKICEGSTANLTNLYTTTGLTTAWTLNGAPVANPAAAGVSGNYQLVVSNVANCFDTAIVRLTIDSVRSNVNVEQIICTTTGRITITPTKGIAPFEYSISSNPGVFQASNEFIANEGTYTITVRDSLGCTNTATATVTIIPEITVNAGQDISIVSGESTTIVATTSGTPSSILWTPATGLSSTTTLNTVANPTVTTTYTITVTNSQGCEADDDVTITVIPYCIRVKNAFTPNGDGINDAWEVYDQFDCLTNVSINVFNRYGKLVFSDRNYRNKWTGLYQGKPIPDGTYYAVVDFTMLGGKKFSVKTDLTILR